MYFVLCNELLACMLLASNAVVFWLGILILYIYRIVRFVPMPDVIHMPMKGFQEYVSVFIFSCHHMHDF